MTGANGWAPPAGPVTLVLNKLDGIRRSGSGWTGRCPAHEDRQASLSVTEGDDGRALVYSGRRHDATEGDARLSGFSRVALPSRLQGGALGRPLVWHGRVNGTCRPVTRSGGTWAGPGPSGTASETECRGSVCCAPRAIGWLNGGGENERNRVIADLDCPESYHEDSFRDRAVEPVHSNHVCRTRLGRQPHRGPNSGVGELGEEPSEALMRTHSRLGNDDDVLALGVLREEGAVRIKPALSSCGRLEREAQCVSKGVEVLGEGPKELSAAIPPAIVSGDVPNASNGQCRDGRYGLRFSEHRRDLTRGGLRSGRSVNASRGLGCVWRGGWHALGRCRQVIVIGPQRLERRRDRMELGPRSKRGRR
jgi:hypothetical protein